MDQTQTGMTPPVQPNTAPLSDQAVVAVYERYDDAEDAVRRLEQAGITMRQVSIIGRDWQVRQDVQGYYSPGDAAVEGATQGAWIGGLFGLLWGIGVFLLPVAGPIIVLGPLGGLIAGAVGGAGIGALVNALIALGIPKDQAIKYEAHLQAGKFLVLVHGTPSEAEHARNILQGTSQSQLDTHVVNKASVL